MNDVSRETKFDLRKKWTIKANACLAGKVILRAYYPNKATLETQGVDEHDPTYGALWIELNDGTIWCAMADDEGNGPGAFACYRHTNQTPKTTQTALNKIGGVLPVML